MKEFTAELYPGKQHRLHIMKVLFTAGILVLTQLAGTAYCTAATSDITESCAMEEFTAQCPDDSVIVMTSARYGRMDLGRCVQKDMGYLGCSSDVISVMDIMCSGRTKCVVRIPDPLLEAARACNAELKSYLEASYTCYNVIAPMNPCSDDIPIKLSNPEGYLSSAVAYRTSCGLQNAPWILKAKPGQQIRVSFLEFNTTEARFHNIGGTQLQCRERAFLMDMYAGRKIKICPRHTRISDVYVSENNTLEVTLPTKSVVEDGNHFLIHYQFVGCVDRTATPGTQFQRTGTQTARVSCLDSEQAFDLVCREGEWDGEVENCTVPGLVQQEDPSKKGTLSGMLLVVLIAVSFILLCIIAAIFIFCVKRLKRGGGHLHHHRCDTHESVYIKNDTPYRPTPGGTLKQLHVEMEPCDYDIASRSMLYKEPPPPSCGRIQNQLTGQECLLCGEQQAREHSEEMLNVQPATYIASRNPRTVHIPCSAKESNIENENRLRKQQQLQLQEKETGTGRPNTVYGYAKHKQIIDNGSATTPKTPLHGTQPQYDIDATLLYQRSYASAQAAAAKKAREAVYVAPPCVDLLNNTV